MEILKRILTGFLILFGAITIFIGISVINDFFGMRERQGYYVPFVVVANTICGFIYLLSAFFIWRKDKKGSKLLFLAFIILLVTIYFFYKYINSGGIYEVRTIYALTFRTSITFLAFLMSVYIIPYKRRKSWHEN
ncbi:MAG: hypothetical protein WDA08_09070 [Weeksellaceae bacterium]